MACSEIYEWRRCLSFASGDKRRCSRLLNALLRIFIRRIDRAECLTQRLDMSVERKSLKENTSRFYSHAIYIAVRQDFLNGKTECILDPAQVRDIRSRRDQ